LLILAIEKNPCITQTRTLAWRRLNGTVKPGIMKILAFYTSAPLQNIFGLIYLMRERLSQEL